MAGESAKPSGSSGGGGATGGGGGRTTFVLVPQGEFAGKPDLPLDRPVTTCGSRHTCRLHLLSRSVSKAHALFVQNSGTVYVADLASRSGVLVNGKPLPFSDLKTGDRVQIGKFTFRFRAPKTAPASRPESVEPQLVALEQDGQDPIAINGRAFLIGRRDTADLALADTAVSTAHAVIFTMDGAWYMRDLGSRTGTKVNGRPIHQQKLEFGDRIEIGKQSLAFQPSALASVEATEEVAVDQLSGSSRIPLSLENEEPTVEEEIPAATEPAEEQPAAYEPLATPAAAAAEDVGELNLDDLSEFAADEAGAAAQPAEELEPLPTEPIAAVEPDHSETLISVDADAADAAGVVPPIDELEPLPTVPEEPSSRLMVDSDLHAQEKLTSSGTHVDLQSEADEALAAAAGDDAGAAEDAASAPLGAESLDDLDLTPLSGAPSAPAPVVSPVPIAPPAAAAAAAAAGPAAAAVSAAGAIAGAAAGLVGGDEGVARQAPVDPHPEVTPRRGWRTTILPPPLEPIPLDETPSPVAPTSSEAAAIAAEQEATAPISEALSSAPPRSPLDLEPLELEPVPEAAEPEIAAPAADAVLSSPPPDDELNLEDLEELQFDEQPPAIPELPVSEGATPPADLPEPITSSSDEAVDWSATPATDYAENVEVIDRTEPTPESALSLAPAVEPALPGADRTATIVPPSPVVETTLTDTGFGRAVEEFTGPSTGPIVEHVEDISVAEPPTEEAPAIAPPFEDRAATAPISAPGVEPPPLSSDDLVVPEFPSDEPRGGAPPAALSAAPPLATAPAPTATALDDLEEFVAVPEDEPAGSALSLESLEELERPATTAEALPPELPAIEAPAAEPAQPADEFALDAPAAAEAAPDIDLSIEDLEDLDDAVATEPPLIADDLTEAPPVVEAPSAPSVEPARAEQAPPGAPAPAQTPPGKSPTATRPSLFGFDFDGDSFLGGMPLKLPGTAATPRAGGKPIRFVPKPPPGAAAEPTPTPGAIAVPPKPVAPARPPPPPAHPAERVARSLTDLSNEQITPRSPQPAPAIPSLAADMTVPPLARPVTGPPAKRKKLTTAFDGLAGGGGETVRNTDVFSQMSRPIKAEAFGTKPGQIDDFEIPAEGGKTSPEAAAPAASLAYEPRAVRGSDPRPQPARRSSRVPMLLMLMFLFAAAAAAAAYRFIPHYEEVTGTLAFSNLARQPEAVQKAFQFEQNKRLRSPEVRNEAKQFTETAGFNAGFLNDPTAFDQAMGKKLDGKQDVVTWNGDTLEISYLAPDGNTGRQQVVYLLTALAQRDADLRDVRARAQSDRDTAKADADSKAILYASLKGQIAKKRQEGEDRPDPVELTRLDAEATRLAKDRDTAHNARMSAEVLLEGLRRLDVSKPLDESSDPQLIDLRKQLQDVNGQIAALRSPSALDSNADANDATTQPALTAVGNVELLKQLQDQANALNTKINQRVATIQADQAISPEQRGVNRDKAVEEQSIQLASLTEKEHTAADAASAAATKLADAKARKDKSDAATTVITDLLSQANTADIQRNAAVATETEKENALAQTIALDGAGDPRVTSQPKQDQRAIGAGVAAGLVILVFMFMILSAHRAHAHSAPIQPVQAMHPAAIPAMPPPAVASATRNTDAFSRGNTAAPEVPPTAKDASAEDQEPVAV
jgi:pSer/pThr/pTyr-binding forkhead associated (FHA) protein